MNLRASTIVLPVRTMRASGMPQISDGARRWSEIQIRDGADETAVHFFGERAVLVPGTKSGFDVADADLFLERGEGGCKSGGGVALHEKPIGRDSPQDR
jgi:hypothetical protein